MRIISFTAGAAAMYCGSCLRDNALAAELRRQGHDVILMPLYTPTRTDEGNASERRVLFGGISVYLRHRLRIHRRLPRLVARLLDAPWLIRAMAARGAKTDPRMLGELTVATLEGRQGVLRAEVDRVAEWLRQAPAPDAVTLPNSMLIALAAPLREAGRCPVICTLQGEELFLQSLQEPWRAQAIELLRRQVGGVDAFVAVSAFSARFMGEWLGIEAAKIHVVPLGIRLDGHRPVERPKQGPRRIGFLGRIAPEKGLHLLCEAYRILRANGGPGNLRLEAAGWLGAEHRGYLREIQRRMHGWGLGAEFHYHGELTRDEKLRFLQSLDVFSMPCSYDEPKGIPVIEAMANAVPVVQPNRGAFPEIIEESGGGLLVAPDSPEALAEGLRLVLDDPELARRLGRNGRDAVASRRTVEAMAARAAEVYAKARSGFASVG